MIARRGLLAVAALPRQAKAAAPRPPAGPVARPARRIVSVHGGAAAQLAALGIAPVGTNLVHPPYVAGMAWLIPPEQRPPGIVNADWSMDAEAVLALEPDLVIVWSDQQAALLAPRVPVYAMRSTLASIAEVRANLIDLAALCGAEDRAAAVLAAFDRRVEAYRRRAPRAGRAVMVSAAAGRRLMVYGGAHVASEALGVLGHAEHPALIGQRGFVEGGVELLHRLDPERIVVVAWDPTLGNALPRALVRDRLWQALRAVRAGQVHALSGYEAIVLPSVPTTARLLDTLAPRLHPDRFSGALDDAAIAAILGG